MTDQRMGPSGREPTAVGPAEPASLSPAAQTSRPAADAGPAVAHEPAPRPQAPAEAWKALSEGNERFVRGQPLHPNQDVQHRGSLAGGQAPFATIFGCGDSRVAAEVIFDQGLGDLFVVRTAGHVVDPAVLGSLEFSTEVLRVPLIVVLGHDSCGAVKAAISSFNNGDVPPGYIRDIVERVTLSVLAAGRRDGTTTTDDVEAEHVRQTMRLMYERSHLIGAAVDQGRLGIIGLVYKLAEGRTAIVEALGDVVGDPGAPSPAGLA